MTDEPIEPRPGEPTPPLIPTGLDAVLAFIRHGDEDVKRYVRWVNEGKRRYMVFGSTMIGLANTSVPNPTFNPIATPGCPSSW